ncbi:large-conductance mechanosensitive channel protein MscL [Jeotgalibacillus sp. JSM ZJ347]|uniref:large-conductance mechanosensitive channel protein MscL n=1 Tax=Jeotgalibacillus sp. JSM ZJ347 TaxID=3342117 RepID=UPI0035A93B2A
MMKEFREFAMRGNVLELAIAVVLGAAFGKIVTALVENIIMPIVGIILGGVNFSALAVTVGNAEVTYGIFIQAVIDFIIVAFAIFLFVKLINRFKRKEEAKEAAAPVVDPQTELLTEIRDLLKNKRV